jgi:hypothetical protein
MTDIEEMIYQAQREDIKDVITKDGLAWKYAIRGKNDKGDKDIRLVVLYKNPGMLIVTAIDKNK